jgi:hypothetical protein
VTEADFQNLHGSEMSLGQRSPVQQFTKIFIGIVPVNEIRIPELSLFPQNPLPGEGSGIRLVDACIPTGAIPKDAVIAFRTLDGVLLDRREIS